MKYFVRQVSAATLCIATYLGTYLGTLAGPGLSSALAEDSCKLTDICSGTAAGIRDGRTVLLADGRELRLAGVEVTESSRSALEALAGGRDLRLKQLGVDRDRYGRLVAFAFVDGGEQSVQEAMLKAARRASPPGSATSPAPICC
jgi:endonuclease YncB( thermonuclease family)